MLVYETAKFKKQRKMLAAGPEKEALKKAVLDVISNPETEMKFQGELSGLRHFNYQVSDRTNKMIYKLTADSIVFMSLGPRHTIVTS